MSWAEVENAHRNRTPQSQTQKQMEFEKPEKPSAWCRPSDSGLYSKFAGTSLEQQSQDRQQVSAIACCVREHRHRRYVRYWRCLVDEHDDQAWTAFAPLQLVGQHARLAGGFINSRRFTTESGEILGTERRKVGEDDVYQD